MEYSCHALTSAPRCYLDMFDRLQKRLCRTVCPSLVADLENLAHHPNVASLSLFYRHYFGRCLSELAEKVQLPHSDGTSIRYSYTFHSYSVTIPGCYKNVFVKSFHP